MEYDFIRLVYIGRKIKFVDYLNLTLKKIDDLREN